MEERALEIRRNGVAYVRGVDKLGWVNICVYVYVCMYVRTYVYMYVASEYTSKTWSWLTVGGEEEESGSNVARSVCLGER